MYTRTLESEIKKKFFKGKIIIIVGARQVGKTTLVNRLLEPVPLDEILRLNGDDPIESLGLSDKGFDELANSIGDKKYIFIDEAQKIPKIDLILKLMIDQFKTSKQIIVSGSSSINLLDRVQEPLTGRKAVFHLYGLSPAEIYGKDDLKIDKNVKALLIYGSYPEVVNAKSNAGKIEILLELASSSLYKDIYQFQNIKNPTVLTKLLQALSLQVGSEVSNTELSSLLGIDKNTVESYLDLLEKNHIIFRLVPIHKKKRKEISKMKKVYFFDLGIRNYFINNLNPISLRDDVGRLWENFLINERKKYISYDKILTGQYFWRTYQGQEVDWVEERGGKVYGYEFKYSIKKGSKVPDEWQEYYGKDFKLIDQGNYKKFIRGEI